MSNAKKCDRCGNYYTDRKDKSLRHRDRTVDYITLESLYNSGRGIDFDLCNDCVAELFEFLHISNEQLIREDRLQNYVALYKGNQLGVDDFLNRIYDLNPDEKAEFLKRCHEETNYGVNSTGGVYQTLEKDIVSTAADLILNDIYGPVCRKEED